MIATNGQSVLEVLDFQEAIKIGLQLSDNIHDNMPWIFTYKGVEFTNANDDTYIITKEGEDREGILFERGEVLMVKDAIVVGFDYLNTYFTVVSNKEVSFSTVIGALKCGYAVQRKGWNGKGMYVVKQVPSVIGLEVIPKMQSLPESAKNLLVSNNTPIRYQNQMLIIDKEGFANSWVPSSSDIFAEDWIILE